MPDFNEVHTVTENLEVKNSEGKVTASINLTLGEMKLKDVLLREIARAEELVLALKAQLESISQ